MSVETLLSKAQVRQYFLLTISPVFLSRLSCGRLKRIIQLASAERKRRFLRNRERKYGNINRGFTEGELDQFLMNVFNKKASLAFRLMAGLGLRVGEVVVIKREHISFRRRQIFIQTEKAGTGDILPLHDEVFRLLKKWCEEYEARIQKSQFLLFSDNPTYVRAHISPHWLRREFRDAARRGGLDTAYGSSDETRESQRSRKLYRLTTHSLRHYFITKIYRSTKDLVVAQRLARHTKMKSTLIYVHSPNEHLSEVMQNVFSGRSISQRVVTDF